MKKWLLLFLLIPAVVFADWQTDGVTDPEKVSGVTRPQGVDGVTCTYFDSWPSSINATYWTETDVPGDLAVAAGELAYDASGTATLESYLTSKWYFAADTDFDIRLDFSDVAWDTPDSDSTGVWLQVEDSGAVEYVNIGRDRKADGSENFRVSGDTTAKTWVVTAQTSGRLRITNISGQLTAYYWDTTQKQWEWGATAGYEFVEDFSGDALYIRLYFRQKDCAGTCTSSVDADNLRIIDGCENITLP